MPGESFLLNLMMALLEDNLILERSIEVDLVTLNINVKLDKTPS